MNSANISAYILKGRLDKWKTGLDCQFWFTLTNEGISFSEDKTMKKSLTCWKPKDIAIIPGSDEELFGITNGKIKYLVKANIADKSVISKWESWISIMLSKESVFLDPECISTINIVCCGELIPYYEEYLQKWSRLRYNNRWVVLSDNTITYYLDSYEETKHGQMALEHTYIYNVSKKNFIITNGTTQYNMVCDNAKQKNEYTQSLVLRGSAIINKAEFEKLAAYNRLRPSLTFPALTSKGGVGDQTNDSNFLNNAKTVAFSMLEHGVDITLSLLVPGGKIISKAIGGAVKGSTKLIDFFTKPDSAEILIEKLDAKIDFKIFHSKLCSLEAEMYATHKRYCNILNKSFTLEERINEIPTAMQSLEKAICLFSTDPLFVANAYQMAPYLVKFSYFYLGFSEIAVAIHHKYKHELAGEMEQLLDCLKSYKKRALATRMAAIKRHDTVVNKLGTLAQIGPIFGSSFWQKAKGNETFTYNLAAHKITDYLYFSNPSDNPKIAYSEMEKGYDDFVEEYKKNIKSLYSSYFDKIISDLENSKIMSGV